MKPGMNSPMDVTRPLVFNGIIWPNLYHFLLLSGSIWHFFHLARHFAAVHRLLLSLLWCHFSWMKAHLPDPKKDALEKLESSSTTRDSLVSSRWLVFMGAPVKIAKHQPTYLLKCKELSGQDIKIRVAQWQKENEWNNKKYTPEKLIFEGVK